MRIVLTVLAGLLCTSVAMAGMTPEEMRTRLKQIDAELAQLAQGPRVHTFDSIQADLRDLDRRRFETDLDLAKINARREVVIARAKEEEVRKSAERTALEQKIKSLRQQRAAMQSELPKVVAKVDNGVLQPHELTAVRLQLIKLDEETATLEFELSGGGSRFSEVLTDIEIDLAGINAVRKALDQRSMELNRRYQQLGDLQSIEYKLHQERQLLVVELESRGLSLE